MKKIFNLFLFSFALLQSEAQNLNPKLDWAYELSGDNSSSYSSGHSIALDKSGNVYSLGTFGNGKTDFDPGFDSFFLSQAINAGSLFILKKDVANNFKWVRSIVSYQNLGGSNVNYIDHIAPIAVDDSGNTYLTGTFTGTIDFDPSSVVQNLYSSNGRVFILKINTDGNLIWAKQLSGQIDSNSIIIDQSGYVYLGGSFVDALADFDPGTIIYHLPLAGNGSAFILKLSNAGDFIWAKAIGGTNYTRANSIATDLSGAVYIAGSFPFTQDFDPGSGVYNLTAILSSQAGGAVQLDGFVCKLDSSGNFAWAKRMGGNVEDGATSLKVDKYGNAYVAGYFRDTATFTPNATPISIAAAGDQDVFLTKINSTGNFIWIKRIGGPLRDEIVSLDIDTLGGLYIMGNFYGTADFDPGISNYNLHATSSADIYIAKTDTAGNFLWARNMGNNDTQGTDDVAKGIAVSPGGDLFSIGNFDGTVDFDPDTSVLNITAQIYSDNCFMLKWKQNTTLPLKLISFTAIKQGKTNLLDWATAKEVNLNDFEIERSGNGKDFMKIGNIPSQALNTPLTENRYKFIDYLPYGRQSFYRLKMIDKDGSSRYSIILKVENASSTLITTFPNPATDFITVSGNNMKRIELLNSDGALLFSRNIFGTSTTIPLSSFNKGIYLLKITSIDNHEACKKIFKSL